jgi:hypothetical protein
MWADVFGSTPAVACANPWYLIDDLSAIILTRLWTTTCALDQYYDGKGCAAQTDRLDCHDLSRACAGETVILAGIGLCCRIPCIYV